MKRMLAIIMSVCLLCAATIPAFAASSNKVVPPELVASETKKISEDSTDASRFSLETSSVGQPYLLNKSTGEKIIKAYAYNEEGKLIEISLSEYAKRIDSSPTVPVADNASVKKETNESRAVTYRYVETSAYDAHGEPLKVSADHAGPGTVDFSYAVTISHEFGGEVALTAMYKELIQIGASFAWYDSLEAQAVTNHDFPVPAGVIGYIQFTPYLNVTVGNLYRSYSESSLPDADLGEVWGASPKRLATGFADGLFALAIK